MKYSVEQQVSFEHVLSMMKGALLKLRPRSSAFIDIREKYGLLRKNAHKWSSWHRAKTAPGIKRPARKHFNFGSILRLRTFAFIIVGTVLLVVYINNLLTINSLSRENERLRERIGVNKSINAAFELELQELAAIHNISEKAEKMGLRARMTPAVNIGTK